MDWVRGKCLGKRSYGSIFLAIPTNIISPPLAVKSALIIDSFSLQKELKILLSLFGSEGFIQCYRDCLSHENGMTIYNLLLEYAPGGSLVDLINKYERKILKCDVRLYTQTILKELSSIHNNRYVHCDLKPTNILVFLFDQQELSQLKITDFGLAKEPDEDDSRKFFYQYTFRGTPLYMSLEFVKLIEISPALNI
ncbi:mitogen-activated protein kinase kinase kinase 17-like [Hevea brasiliensis]|uniref:mitogen-activated protein kinase kinase kinase 17-like n=1 Tax=Hevea brasiliensis TaxID=3981 RepID=UPI0025FB4F69|nr:mitogen-activated protein kinase kinase kinase 17-like [Hevea brasiliensis]